MIHAHKDVLSDVLAIGHHIELHTVKFGDCADPDWIASPELDALVKGTDPETLL